MKARKKLSAILLCVALLLTALPVTAFAADSGTGCTVSGCGGTYVNGFCSVCGGHQAATPNNGVYELGNAGQLYWFAELVNGTLSDVTQNPSANGKLTADIIINSNVLKSDGTLNDTPSRTWTPIGFGSSSYYGSFDGDNHTVSGLYFYNATGLKDTQYVGLFGTVGKNGTVKNVTVKDSYIYACQYIGGIAGENSGTVTGCSSFATLIGKDPNVGGVVGYNYKGKVTECSNFGTVKGAAHVGGVIGWNYNNATITSCYNTGTVTGWSNKSGNGYNVGGVVGYNSAATITDCYNTGTVTGQSNRIGGVVGFNSSGTVTNCYYLSGCAKDGSSKVQNGLGSDTQGAYTADTDGITEGKTAAQFTSGEAAYLLNGGSSEGNLVWKQTLGTDKLPNFTGKTVYSFKNCMGTIAYSNESLSDGAHIYANGICTTCSSYEEPTLNSEGYYELSNLGQLLAFAERIKSGSTSINGRLTADIDLDGKEWTAMGTELKPYTGTFDGCGKTISNLYVTATSNNQGLFGVVNGGTVKNFTVKGTIVIAATAANSNDSVYNGVQQVGAAVGYAYGNTRLDGIISYVNINDTGKNANVRNQAIGGVVGLLTGSTVSNSSYYGTLKMQASSQIGGIVGVAQNNSTVSSCSNRGTVESTGATHHIGGVAGAAATGTAVQYCLNYGSVTSGGGDCVGGVVGYSNENVSITCCGNTGSINCTVFSTAVGGVLGYVNNKSFKSLASCFNYGTVTVTSTIGGGAIVGNCNNGTNTSVFKNNYYLAGSSANASNTQIIPDVYSITSEQFKSGELTYLLNGKTDAGVWKQTLKSDNYPNFTGKNIYYGYISCADNTKGYTNNENAQTNRPYHATYENGFCTVCDAYEEPKPDSNGCYELDNAGKLFRFAEYVNAGDTDACARLTADIDLENRLWTPIGLYTDDPALRSSRANTSFIGTFDGQYHLIKNFKVEMTEHYEAGLFSRVAKGGVLKSFGVINVTVLQNTDGHESKGVRAGIVAGELFQATVTNVFSAGTLTLETKHDQYGGLAGECKDSTLTGCFTTLGRLTDGTEGNTPTVATDCYYMANSSNAASVGTNMTTAQFKSGAVTYLLNGKTTDGIWKQTINSVAYPSFTGGTVYYGYLSCGDTAMTYTNNENAQADKPEHTYEGNTCKVCGAYRPCEGEGTAEKPYLIKNADNLYWFAQQVNSGNNAIHGKLTADIPVNSNVLKSDGTLNGDGSNFRAWTRIGYYKSGTEYIGTFDGDGYTISGLYFDAGETYVGLFGSVDKNGTVKNVTVKDSYIRGGSKLGGVVGYNNYGTVTNCCYTGTVIGTTGSTGGVVGYNRYGTVTNCYNTGKVTGNYHLSSDGVGGVVGYSYWGTVKNCYNTGTVKNVNYVGGVIGYYKAAKIENCYYLTGCATNNRNIVQNGIGNIYPDEATADDKNKNETTAKTKKQFESGEVAYLLNGSKSEGELAWYQTIKTDTVPVFSGKIVYFDETDYYNLETGDINGDGTVDIRDLIRMKKNLAAESKDNNMDLNNDKSVDSLDLACLRKFLLGLLKFN